MKSAIIFMKISLIVKNLFDRKTGPELQAMKDHFTAAFSDAQLCALVLIGMVIRVFGLVPKPTDKSRSLWMVVGLFVTFLQSLDDPVDMLRAGPNPLDGMVAEGLDELDHLEKF